MSSELEDFMNKRSNFLSATHGQDDLAQNLTQFQNDDCQSNDSSPRKKRGNFNQIMDLQKFSIQQQLARSQDSLSPDQKSVLSSLNPTQIFNFDQIIDSKQSSFHNLPHSPLNQSNNSSYDQFNSSFIYENRGVDLKLQQSISLNKKISSQLEKICKEQSSLIQKLLNEESTVDFSKLNMDSVNSDLSDCKKTNLQAKYINTQNKFDLKKIKKEMSQQSMQQIRQVEIEKFFEADMDFQEQNRHEIQRIADKLQEQSIDQKVLYNRQLQLKEVKRLEKLNNFFIENLQVPFGEIDKLFKMEKIKHQKRQETKMKALILAKEPEQPLGKYNLEFKQMEGLKEMRKQEVKNLTESWKKTQEYFSDNPKLIDYLKMLEFQRLQQISKQLQKDDLEKQNKIDKNLLFSQFNLITTNKRLKKTLEQPAKRNRIIQNNIVQKKKIDYQNVRDFTKENQKSDDFLLQRGIKEHYPSLFCFNIPKMIKFTAFSRKQLYELFSKFKAILIYESEMNRKKLKNKPKTEQLENQYSNSSTNYLDYTKDKADNIEIEKGKGIGMKLFQQTNHALQVAPEKIVRHIFNAHASIGSRGKMDWESFLKTVNMLEARTTQAKIELFMELMDKEKNGFIIYEDIIEASNNLLSKICSDPQMELSHLLTKTIYKNLQISEKDKITKNMLLQSLQQSSQEIEDEDEEEEQQNNTVQQSKNDLELLLMLCISGNQLEGVFSYEDNYQDEDDLFDQKFSKGMKSSEDIQDYFSKVEYT